MFEHLRNLRTTWSDSIPKSIIHSDSPNNRYKVRRNWFVGIVADVENLLNENEIGTDAGRQAAEQLLNRFTSKEFIDRERTTSEDIQTANRLIDVILKSRQAGS